VFQFALGFISERAKQGLLPEEEDLQELNRVRERLTVHARHLLHLGRPEQNSNARTDLVQVLHETIAMLQSAGILRSAKMHVDTPSEPVWVRVERIRIEQIIVNLVKNSIDAMKMGVPGFSPSLHLTVTRDTKENLVSCRIEDNGCGIPEDKLSTIFEPYYTTKPPEKGTGLGLFVVKQIIETAKGNLALTSTVGSGTIFTFRLPIADSKLNDPISSSRSD
jgi:signal transduction histidine kinase